MKDAVTVAGNRGARYKGKWRVRGDREGPVTIWYIEADKKFYNRLLHGDSRLSKDRLDRESHVSDKNDICGHQRGQTGANSCFRFRLTLVSIGSVGVFGVGYSFYNRLQSCDFGLARQS